MHLPIRRAPLRSISRTHTQTRRQQLRRSCRWLWGSAPLSLGAWLPRLSFSGRDRARFVSSEPSPPAPNTADEPQDRPARPPPSHAIPRGQCLIPMALGSTF